MTIDATEIIDDADEQVGEWRNYARPAAEWFHDHEGHLFERDEAIEELIEELDTSQEVVREVISNLVADIVDPVVQVPLNNSEYVGIVEFHTFDGAYGYINFDDIRGKEKRVVCAQCVHNAEHDSEVVHATSGDPNGSFEKNDDYDKLVDGIHTHYQTHNSKPETVETGATLASGTTIGGETSIHAGNRDTYGVDTFGVGSLTDGDVLQNSGGSLTNTALSWGNVSNKPANTSTEGNNFKWRILGIGQISDGTSKNYNIRYAGSTMSYNWSNDYGGGVYATGIELNYGGDFDSSRYVDTTIDYADGSTYTFQDQGKTDISNGYVTGFTTEYDAPENFDVDITISMRLRVQDFAQHTHTI